MEERRKILLHACCGPCSTSSIERLISEEWHPVLYFSNSNIDTPGEFDKRYEELLKVARCYSLSVMKDSYEHSSWLDAVRGYEGEREGGERCSICFTYSLERACIKAKELSIPHFTTTLTVSRFKSSERIFKIGEAFAGFERIDFKKKDGFNRSVELSRKMGLYRQNYCGCEFSKRMRYEKTH